MCDTFVALGNSTRDKTVLFAKNSDRHPNEPHIMIHVPRQQYSKNCQLRATHITLPQVAETYEVMLLKPSWIWGCEMGSNEFGLNIGNEAVFTKEKYEPNGLIGMDMIRIALERCQTSEQALEMLCQLISDYGQGGNCGFVGSTQYHNSFLMADRDSAWVLESAGRYWAAKKVKDIYCISNCLTIEKDFDRCHPDLIRNAVNKKWCKNENDFNFKQCYGNHFTTNLTWAQKRLFCSYSILAGERNQITAHTMKKVLRSHTHNLKIKPFAQGSMKSVCMHGGGIMKSHTTGSYIASIKDSISTYWVTGASTPCLSVYKPLWLHEKAPLFSEQAHNTAVEYWRVREKLHRLVLLGLVDLPAYCRQQIQLEECFDQIEQDIDFKTIPKEKLAEIAADAFQCEDELIRKTIDLAHNSGRKSKMSGNWFYRFNWRNLNRKLEIF